MEARVEKPHRIAGYCRISVDVEADRDNTSIETRRTSFPTMFSGIFRRAS